MSSIIFNGRAHYAKRDAMLEVVNNQLVVSNLSHPADGVIIDTAGVSGLKLDFLPHTLAQGEVLGATLNMRDGLDRMKSVAQWALCPDSSGKVAAKAGGKTVRAGVPAVRTDIAGLPRKARKRPLTFSLGGDSVRFLQLTDNIS